MENEPRVPHRQFVEWLSNLDDDKVVRDMEKLSKTDESLDRLFFLLKELTPYLQEKHSPDRQIASASFSDIEELLLPLYSGNYKAEQARQFVQGMKTSPLFYNRVLAKLRQMASMAQTTEVPEMADVKMKSDQEILEEYILSNNQERTETRVAASKGRMTGILEKIRNFLFPLNPLPKYAFAMAVALILFVLGPNIQHNLDTRSLFEDYLVEVAYGHSGMRTGSAVLDGNPDAQDFVMHFEMTIANYLISDYRAAIEGFEALEPAAIDLVAGADDDGFPSLIRDYYFYYGYSHLAVAKPAVIDFKRNEEMYHLSEAIRLFAEAELLAQSHALDNLDRETYFSALANGLIGNKRVAVEKLRQISANSDYFEDADRLIKKWSGR